MRGRTCRTAPIPDYAALHPGYASYEPTASATHFFMWLALAAPASFF
jgi:hypothetical protein